MVFYRILFEYIYIGDIMVKKVMVIFLISFLLTGCGSLRLHSDIVSFIEQNDRMIVGMHYPSTGIHKFDQIISSFVQNTYDSFQKDYGSFIQLGYQPELNIDYHYQVVNERYLNVTLWTFVGAGDLAHPIHEVHTFIFDVKRNKILTLKDFVTIDSLKKLIPMIQQKLISEYKDCLFLESLSSKIVADYHSYNNFTVSDNSFTFYFNPYEVAAGSCGIVDVEIPFENIPLSLPIHSDSLQETFYESKPVSRSIDPSKPIIALTFDDGPSKYTKEIGDFLQSQGASATFFILGNKVDLYSSTLQILIKNGNEIGNHSYNHKWLTRLSDEEFREQIDMTNRLVKDKFNYDIRYLRPTYGAVNQKLRDTSGMDIVMWSIDTRDWKLKDSKAIADIAINEAKDGKIILMHDTRQRTVDAVKILVPDLMKKGYQFVTVSELNEVLLLRQQRSHE